MPREKIIEQLKALCGSVDSTGRRLIERAVQRADEPFVSGPHFLLAAPHLPDLMAALQKPKVHRDLWDLLRRDEVVESLGRWVLLPSEYVHAECCTYGLAAALRQVRQRAGNDTLSGSALLQAIVDYDIDTKTALAAAEHPVTDPRIPSVSTPTWPGGSWNSSGVGYPATNTSFDPPTRREATTTLFYAERHHLDMEAVLNELASDQHQLVIVRGLYGSPRQRLPHILADILAHPANPLDRQRFGEINHVFVQDVAPYYGVSMQVRDGEGAAQNLANSLRLARTLRGILVLNRGELLVGNAFHEANKQILSALSRHHDVRVVISYEDTDELEGARQLQLPIINYSDVTMEPYSPEHTRNALHDYYDQYWRSQGIIVEADALDTVLYFEPAIYSHVAGVPKRKALPYSMADLLNATIGALRKAIMSNSSSLLEIHARMAHEHVMKLLDPENEGEGLQLFSAVDALDDIAKNANEESNLRDKARKLHRRWYPICEALGELPERMKALADHPQVRRSPRTSLYIVAQDMVTAHLFSDAQYHVRLIKAFRDSVELSAPSLLTIIRRYVAQAGN